MHRHFLEGVVVTLSAYPLAHIHVSLLSRHLPVEAFLEGRTGVTFPSSHLSFSSSLPVVGAHKAAGIEMILAFVLIPSPLLSTWWGGGGL